MEEGKWVYDTVTGWEKHPANPSPQRLEQHPVLGVRGKTHGNYNDDARVATSIWALMEREDNWAKLMPCQRHALTLIGVKLARILVGDYNHEDHWVDIAGYSTLVAERLKIPPSNIRP